MTLEGKTQAQIAKSVNVSVATIRYHIAKNKKPVKQEAKASPEKSVEKTLISELKNQNRILWDLVNSMNHK